MSELSKKEPLFTSCGQPGQDIQSGSIGALFPALSSSGADVVTSCHRCVPRVVVTVPFVLGERGAAGHVHDRATSLLVQLSHLSLPPFL